MIGKKTVTLVSGDFKNVLRDSTLILAAFAPVLIVPIVRFGIPQLQLLLQSRAGFDLTPHYYFITGLLLLVPPLLTGTIVGFMILDDRDERVLEFISVTPLSKTGYLLYRVISAAVAAFCGSLFVVSLTGLISFPFFKTALIALVAATEAPIVALFLAAFAGNKVEGLALSKATGVFFIASFIGYIVDSPLQYLAGIVPPFWITETFSALFESNALFIFLLLGGTFVHCLFIWAFLTIFNRRIG